MATTNLINPWKRISSDGAFVLDKDRLHIEAFNQAYKEFHGSKVDGLINLDFTPEPRLGPINAPVVILQHNPSYSRPQTDEEIKVCISSLHDEYFPHLGIKYKNDWWMRRSMGVLARTFNNDTELLSNNICSIEFFPYRSLSFCHNSLALPSQQYTFELVRRSLADGAIIIITRGRLTWCSAIPELVSGLNNTVFWTRNPQNSSISEGNLQAGAFEQICASIKNRL